MSDPARDEVRRLGPASTRVRAFSGGSARYVYGIVPADAGEAVDLGGVGLDGSRVYVVVRRRIGALVHDCPAEPYDSGGDAVVAQWVLAHDRVMQLAMARWRSVLPMTFNTIVAPSVEKTADENLLAWLEAEHDSLRERVDNLEGKAEYGLQVSYAPAVILRQVAEEVPEVRRLEEEAQATTSGLAYLYRQELERLLRRETERRVRELFTAVYERARSCADRVNVEKVKSDTSDPRMAVNLSCLIALERYPELKALADEVAGHEGHTVRLVGPLPPYSFC